MEKIGGVGDFTHKKRKSSKKEKSDRDNNCTLDQNSVYIQNYMNTDTDIRKDERKKYIFTIS